MVGIGRPAVEVPSDADRDVRALARLGRIVRPRRLGASLHR
jgi:hypothetical protein